jgi:hypothetical protein
LLCALVLAPKTYTRNKFFRFYEQPELAKVRRRAARVRGIIRQLGGGSAAAIGQIIGEQVFDDRVLLRYKLDAIHFARTTALTPLEAALVHYALHVATGAEVSVSDRELVLRTTGRLSLSFELPARALVPPRNGSPGAQKETP